MEKQYQRVTLNFFLNTESELDVNELAKILKRSGDYQHDNLSVYQHGEYAIEIDIYAMDFVDPARSRSTVKKLLSDILERL